VSSATSIPHGPAPSLTIVIPALNEEEAIGGTIERCLAARAHIKEVAGLTDVEIIVVSDGSTDRTVEIARSFREVKVIEFVQNRGYGAAIQEGWRQGKGTLVSFLDADGTCDPQYFADMCRLARRESADVVLGSRLGPQSRMPRVRRLGNRLYALLLGFLCGRHVTDTASGMRVVRRQSLRHLYPLPSGLHFTPAMSARALLNSLRVLEIPMSYEERIGRSKLSVLRDGVRFLQAIFTGVLSYSPERPLLLVFGLCMLMTIMLAAYPVEFYVTNRYLEEWMIYRFVACYVLVSFALLILLATALVNRMATLTSRRAESVAFWPSLVAELFSGWLLCVTEVFLLGLTFFFLFPGILEYISTRHVSMHWSRLLAGAFSLSSAFQVGIFSLLLTVTSVWKAQSDYDKSVTTASSENPPGSSWDN
jgi:glycosyltransferase involved in cell wall biosynthesis